MKSGFNQVRRAPVTTGRGLVVAIAMAALLTICVSAFAFEEPQKEAAQEPVVMHTYVIERTIPGAGNFSQEKLRDISQHSDQVLRGMGTDIQWVQSYVTGDKIYCIYRAKNADLVLEHAKRGGFPADSVNEVKEIIDPSTGN
jgi:hypothetical protein